jgi:hypothetical protein
MAAATDYIGKDGSNSDPLLKPKSRFSRTPAPSRTGLPLMTFRIFRALSMEDLLFERILVYGFQVEVLLLLPFSLKD